MATSKRNTRRRKAPTERENGNTMTFGQPYVEHRGKVAGTPTGQEGARRKGYAASNVIHRGAANQLRAQLLGDQKKHLCLCGCELEPSNPDSLFMPGHDSKVRAMGKAVLEGRLDKSKLSEEQMLYLHEGGML